MQQDPGFAINGSGKVCDHGVHADDEIKPPEAMTQRNDIGRADIARANLG
jgi:hypothetical protein